jgi:hypothetical protein
MGKMKQLYMEIEDHYDGNVPEGLTLSEYLQIKRKENEEWEETAKYATQRKSCENDESLDGNGSSSKKESCG